MKKSIILLFAALALATTAQAQVEITSTSVFMHRNSEDVTINWGTCFDALNQNYTPVKMEQDGNSIHFTIWSNSLKDFKEFTIKHDQLSDGMASLMRLDNRMKDENTQIVVSKNFFSFDEEFVVGIYLSDGTGVLYNEKNEKVGVLPLGVLHAPGTWMGAYAGFAYYEGIPYLAGIENKNGDAPIYSISCWADGKQPLHKQADLTSDGQVDVSDVNKIIDIVLGRE